MKSTNLNFSYTVPELLGDSIDGTAELFALRREIAFLREEYGASFTLRRPVERFGGDATLRYSIESLRNSRNALVRRPTDTDELSVASLTFALNGDRRDNPLLPRHGYSWITRLQVANPSFGGDSRYQRLELGGSYHTAWGDSRWLHAGLFHGVITTIDGDDSTLPINRRFYPGGDSIRRARCTSPSDSRSNTDRRPP